MSLSLPVDGVAVRNQHNTHKLKHRWLWFALIGSLVLALPLFVTAGDSQITRSQRIPIFDGNEQVPVLEIDTSADFETEEALTGDDGAPAGADGVDCSGHRWLSFMLVDAVTVTTMTASVYVRGGDNDDWVALHDMSGAITINVDLTAQVVGVSPVDVGGWDRCYVRVVRNGGGAWGTLNKSVKVF